jgi:hypothetical protein
MAAYQWQLIGTAMDIGLDRTAEDEGMRRG